MTDTTDYQPMTEVESDEDIEAQLAELEADETETEADADLDADGDEAETPAKSGKSAPAKSTASTKGRDKTLVRRTVRKTLEVQNADSAVVDIAAGLLGKHSDDVEGIVTAILTADGRRQMLQPITDIEELKASRPIETSAIATALGRDALKAVWSLLSQLGRADGALPTSLVSSAIDVSVAVTEELTDSDLETLRSVSELMKRS